LHDVIELHHDSHTLALVDCDGVELQVFVHEDKAALVVEKTVEFRCLCSGWCLLPRLARLANRMHKILSQQTKVDIEVPCCQVIRQMVRRISSVMGKVRTFVTQNFVTCGRNRNLCNVNMVVIVTGYTCDAQMPRSINLIPLIICRCWHSNVKHTPCRHIQPPCLGMHILTARSLFFPLDQSKGKLDAFVHASRVGCT